MLLLNIPTSTLGGKVFWLTISTKNGWKLQRHILTKHYRILYRDNKRHAWTMDEHAARTAFGKIEYALFIKKNS